jgi:hypothetical protein
MVSIIKKDKMYLVSIALNSEYMSFSSCASAASIRALLALASAIRVHLRSNGVTSLAAQTLISSNHNSSKSLTGYMCCVNETRFIFFAILPHKPSPERAATLDVESTFGIISISIDVWVYYFAPTRA